MKIAVCIKQVPVISMLRFDEENRRLVREGVPNEMNPYDLLGLSLAANLKAEHGAEIVAVSMGPPQASDALVQAMAMGADRAVHLNDRAFAGSDTLATASALAAALRRESPDLIICGRNSADAETGQVGPEIAEIMDIPQLTAVSALSLHADARSLAATRLTDSGQQDLECDLPALVTVTDGVANEVYPRRERMAEAATRSIEQLTAADLSEDPSSFGIVGSPTSVEEVFSVEINRLGRIVRDLPPEESVKQLMAFLEGRGVFDDDHATTQTARPRGPRSSNSHRLSDCYPGAIWVLAEIMGDTVRQVTLELLGRSREVAEEIGTTVEAVLIGSSDIEHIRRLTAYGADTVRVTDDALLTGYDTESHTAVLGAAIERHSPYAVLIPSTANGRDLAARVAGRLGLGLTGDCVGIEIDADGRLAQLKPAFGGSVVAPILSRTLPNMATIRPGILAACEPDWSIEPVVAKIDTVEPVPARVRVIRTVIDESADGAELEHARRIVSVGKGIGGPENLAQIRDLADTLDAAIGATRDVADLGWLPRQYQIGISGKAVAPELYIAIGIRGPFNHTVGIQRAGTVVAVNDRARSPIFRAADIGILGDWKDIIPAMTAAIENRMPNRIST